MNNYIDTIDSDVLEYFKFLSGGIFPEWMNEYINTKEVLHQKDIGLSCGAYYTKLQKTVKFYSNLEHSIGVALIVWNFTHDKRQTLSGLLHDISTPVFKHCIDFFNGDSETQESTEELTKSIINNSDEIKKLLQRDGISIEDVWDYQKYPIADNKAPKLSADRLEYTLSSAVFTYHWIGIKEAREIYENLYVGKNENSEDELVFNDIKYAKKFVQIMNKNSIIWINDNTRFSMQCVAEMIRKIHDEGLINKSDLYKMTEKEVIELLDKSDCKNILHKWMDAEEVIVSKVEPKNVFWVRCKSKKRYINPMLNGGRIGDLDLESKNLIEEILNVNMDSYLSYPGILF